MPWVWGREPPVQSGAPPLLTSAAVAGEQEAAQQRQGSQPSAAHGRPHRARTPTAAKEPGSWSPAADVTDEGRGRSEGGTPDCPHPTHTHEGGLHQRGKAGGSEQVAGEPEAFPGAGLQMRTHLAGFPGAGKCHSGRPVRFFLFPRQRERAAIPHLGQGRRGSLGGLNGASPGSGSGSGWGESREPPTKNSACGEPAVPGPRASHPWETPLCYVLPH